MLAEIKKKSAELLSEASGEDEQIILPTIDMGKYGDLSSRIAFIVSKKEKKKPSEIAKTIVGKIKKNNYFEKVEATGPYVNFYFSSHAYSSLLSHILSKKELFGSGKKKSGKTIVEFPSVNPNKPWHVGHLRNALLGDSISRILEFDGSKVERMDYIDDLGLQVAQSLWGVMNRKTEPKKKLDMWLGEKYVEISKEFEEDPEIQKSVHNLLKKMERGDNEVASAGRKLAEECVKAQYETSFNFGIYHDVLVCESDIMRVLFDDGIKYLKNSDAVVQENKGPNKGCWIVRFSHNSVFGNMENPDKILIRSDGTAVYTGKDVIFHLWKFGKLPDKFSYLEFIRQPDGNTAYISSADGNKMKFGNGTKIINVIGVEQKYPQMVIKEVFGRLGFQKETENFHHLSYEQVALPEGKFSGRKGTWRGYTADNLLDEAVGRVVKKINSNSPGKVCSKIAKIVGVAAIKFSFLRTNSDKRIIFRWEDALNMEGDSGPYLQYAYVRTKGILGKTKERPEVHEVGFNESEKQLLKRLSIFPDLVSRSARELAPHQVAQYAIDVATDFSRFYVNSPVLAAEDDLTMKTRLAITRATGIVLKNSLNLLGIECPEKM